MNIQSTFDHILKIVIVGESGVGKTNFLFRFVEGHFSRTYQSTVGLDYKSKMCNLPHSKKHVKLQLWDTAGQERYMSVTKIFFQKVQGIVLMYDITNRQSFERLPKWVQLINDGTYNIPVILIGNKLDDENENRIVRKEEGKEFAKENGYLFYEASALNGKNVNNAFYDLSEAIISSLEVSLQINASTSLNEYFSIKQKKKPKERYERCC